MVRMREIKDKLMIYDISDFRITLEAEQFVRESLFHAKEGVTSFEEVRIAFNRYCQLNWVIFNTHGSDGHTCLPGGGIDESNVNHVFRFANVALGFNARVLFTGCNIADGDTGRNFLVSVGRTFLQGKGGFVGGCDSKTLAFAGITWRLWGKLITYQFDMNGNIIGVDQR